ncbi:MAG TPA: SRPBCC family protein [Gemmatimonadota bacterium]|jgi:carbon monoxide dehydrogenase subunit G
MPEIRISRSLAAPPARVWPWLADAGRWPEWMPGVRSSIVTNAPDEGVGRRQRLDLAYGGQRGEIDLEITEWEPERRLGWRHLSETIGGRTQDFVRDVRTRILLAPSGSGTELTVEGSWEPAGFLGRMVGATLVRGRAEDLLRQAADNLERLAAGRG